MRALRPDLLRLMTWAVMGLALFVQQATAQEPYDKRIFAVDLGSYLLDLEAEYGSLNALRRTSQIDRPVQTEQAIANIISTRKEALDTTVFLVWDRTAPIKISADDLNNNIARLRKAALQFSGSYRSRPADTPPAIVLTLIEAMDGTLRGAQNAARNNGRAEPTLHMVWVGRRWTQDFVDANGNLNGQAGEDSSNVVYPDSCMGTPAAQDILAENRINKDWVVDFELHLVGSQTAPSERAVRGLMHRFGHFDYTQPAPGQKFESTSTQSYLGTFLPGCSIEPRLDPAIPSFQLGQDEQNGQCKPLRRRVAADPKYVIRCDEFDAYHASLSLRRQAGAGTSTGPAAVVAVQAKGIPLATTKVDLLFTATGHGRGQASSSRLDSWISGLPVSTEIEIRLRIETATICGSGDEFYVEFDVNDPRLDFQGRFHAVVSSLPCNANGAAFVTVPIGGLKVS